MPAMAGREKVEKGTGPFFATFPFDFWRIRFALSAACINPFQINGCEVCQPIR
jgi:hypothetical protein